MSLLLAWIYLTFEVWNGSCPIPQYSRINFTLILLRSSRHPCFSSIDVGDCCLCCTPIRHLVRLVPLTSLLFCRSFFPLIYFRLDSFNLSSHYFELQGWILFIFKTVTLIFLSLNYLFTTKLNVWIIISIHKTMLHLFQVWY